MPRFKIVFPSNSDQKKDSPKEQEENKDRSDYAKIYVAGVDWYATKSELEEVLSQFGEISDITIPKNPSTGKSKGFAFVEFESKESAKDALDFDGKLELKGRKLILQKFKE
ncbi:MAG: RNA-binding protein [Bacteroidia bacterium]|nr:RNA-binding protein [Bacteroidia bacterium]